MHNSNHISHAGFESAKRRIRTSRRGVGLGELLIAVSITAALLVAVAAATHAGFRSYEANLAEGDAAQRARMVLDRALALLRSTDDHGDHEAGPLAPDARAAFTLGHVAEDDGFVVFEPVGGGFRRIEWRLDGDRLVQSVDGGEARTVLRGVAGFRCAFQPMRSPDNRRRGVRGHDQLRRATLVLTVGVPGGDGTFTLSGSASPRRNVGV